MSEDRRELDERFRSELGEGELEEALALGRRIAAASRTGLPLNHALGLTARMALERDPRGPEAIARWRARFVAERRPRSVELDITDAALRGLRDPELAFFCNRVLRMMIGADMSA